jgi:FkbM family methyltransferase
MFVQNTSDDALTDILRPRRLTAVVDIGANPIDGISPYKKMLEMGLCSVVGFEPSLEAIRRLNLQKGPMECYLPYAIGDGKERVLFVCEAPGMTSLLEPDPEKLSLFFGFHDFGRVNRRMDIVTRRLDDIAEIKEIDFLKIDAQGGELDVFRSSPKKLADVVVIQTEVSFIPLYREQPPIGVIDSELRKMGFLPYSFVEMKSWPLASTVPGSYPLKGHWQPMIEADLVYVRDFTRRENLTGEQWKHLALIAHHCYGSADLAIHALSMATKLGVIAPEATERYVKSLSSERKA